MHRLPDTMTIFVSGSLLHITLSTMSALNTQAQSTPANTLLLDILSTCIMSIEGATIRQTMKGPTSRSEFIGLVIMITTMTGTMDIDVNLRKQMHMIHQSQEGTAMIYGTMMCQNDPCMATCQVWIIL